MAADSRRKAGADTSTAFWRAVAQVHLDRPAGLAALEALFVGGTVPSDLRGPMQGRFITSTVNRPIDVAMHAFTSSWLPWKGKTFDPASSSGRNLFTAGRQAHDAGDPAALPAGRRRRRPAQRVSLRDDDRPERVHAWRRSAPYRLPRCRRKTRGGRSARCSTNSCRSTTPTTSAKRCSSSVARCAEPPGSPSNRASAHAS